MPNFMDGLNISVYSPFYGAEIEFSINDEQYKLPNMNRYFDLVDQYDDVKFETGSHWTHHYGLESKITSTNITIIIGQNF